MQEIVEHVRSEWADKKPEDYSQFDLISLNQILCFFNKTEINRIHPDAYKNAAKVIGKLQNCNPEVIQAFANLSIHPKAFGSPNTWSKFDVRLISLVEFFSLNLFLINFQLQIGIIGVVATGLSAQEFQLISTDLGSVIKKNNNLSN